MRKLERIVQRLRDGTGTLTYQELAYLLSQFGYVSVHTGKTSGSRMAFYHTENHDIIRLHKPHPGNELKDYQRKLIKTHLTEQGLI